jgi:hypothetical protein
MSEFLGRPTTRLAASALVLGAAVAGFLVVLLSSPARVQPTLLDQPITVKRALSTTAALFGDRIGAEVDVYTDDRVIDPRSVRLRPDFRPYRAVTTTVDRVRRGHVSLLRTRISLACLTRDCVPPSTGGVLRFRPLRITYRAGASARNRDVSWEPIQVLSRVPADLSARVGVVDTAPPLDSRFGTSPTLLRWLLGLAAALLALIGAMLVVSGLWPPLFSFFRRARPLSPLEASLAEVEAAAQRGDERARRHVLEQLALRLGELPSPSLEATTRELAWAEAVPEPDALTRLAQQVRASLNGALRR